MRHVVAVEWHHVAENICARSSVCQGSNIYILKKRIGLRDFNCWHEPQKTSVRYTSMACSALSKVDFFLIIDTPVLINLLAIYCSVTV